MPTYEEGMPDPNPPFDQFTNDKFNYPYILRNNLTSRRWITIGVQFISKTNI